MKHSKHKIQIQNVGMIFNPGQSTSVPVLEGIGLEVEEGEFVCIVGPSGCGKSTLLNIVAGFLNPTEGTVLVDEQQVVGPDSRRVFIFQENGVFPWLTVEENVGFGLLLKEPGERKRILSHYIAMVGLAGFEKAYPRELSGGMKQRVEIARALAANPDVLYMDEPFGALDFLTRLRMRSELIQIWQRERKTVLFVTHDVEESVQLADRVVVMSRRPATIRSIVPVRLPRPRDLDSPAYLEIRDEIFHIMGLDISGFSLEEKNRKDDSAWLPSFTAASKTKKMDTDVIIIGGGPAGSALGTYLGQAGVDHMIIDKTHHPRPHVGESLICATTDILHEIGFLPVMEREKFIQRRGICWSSWFDLSETNLDFCDFEGAANYSYHVDRAKFDDLLLQHAREAGSRVVAGAQIERVEFNRDGRATGITAKIGESHFPLRARIIVDASGRQALLGKQLQLMKPDRDFHQFAMHSWFGGVDRGEKPDSTNLHMLPIPRGWAWQIPITDEITSIGVVTDRDHFPKVGHDADQFFQDTIRLNQVLASRMRNAERLREFRMDGNYSYRMDRLVGDGWMMIGDAAFFVDPIFSSGVSNALYSAKYAAESILQALAESDVNPEPLLKYEKKLGYGAAIWQSLIRLFYDVSPIFSRIVAQSLNRTKILKLCEGEVYDNHVEETLENLKQECVTIRNSPDHPFSAYLP